MIPVMLMAALAGVLLAIIVFWPSRPKPDPLPPGAFYPTFSDTPISWWKCPLGHAEIGGVTEDPGHRCFRCAMEVSQPVREPWVRVVSDIEARDLTTAIELGLTR